MSTRNTTVLVVDDDFDIRDTLHDVLSDAGYDSAFAADGIEALAYLRANPPPCLILLDWMMPRCDGATFRAEQRQDPTIAGIPVVLLTADVNIGKKTQALDAVAYLHKPVDLERLWSVLRAHCCSGS